MARLDVVVSLSSLFAQHRDSKLAPARKAMNFMTAPYKALGALCLFLALAMSALAQVVIPEGISQWSTQIKAGPLLVDMATGNIVMTVTARSKPGAMPFAFNLNYNVGNQGYINNGGAFLSSMPSANMTGFHRPNLIDCGPQPGPYTLQYGDNIHSNLWWVIDGTGATHYFSFVDAILVGPLRQGCGGDWGPDTSVAVDGSGYTAVVTGSQDSNGSLTWVVYNKDGVATSSSLSGWTDPDGNTITSAYTDTLGQSAISWTSGGGLPGGGHSANPDQAFYTDFSGTTNQYYTVAYSAQHIKTVFGCTGSYSDQDVTGVYLPSTLTTPTGGQYVFTYETTPNNSPDVTGRLQRVTFPTGGYISFAYGNYGSLGVNGFNCLSRIVPQLQITENDGNGHNSTTTYQNNLNLSTPGATFTVIETDQLGDVTTHNFSGEIETQRIVSDVNLGQLSKTVTCYEGNFTNCATAGVGVGGLIFQTDVYTYIRTSQPSMVETTFDTYGNKTSVSRYDVGAGFPPAASSYISKTTYTYDTSTGPCGALSNPYIYDRPCTVKTVNSAGAQMSLTNYTYDAKGHLTQTSQWVSGSTYLTSSASYNSSNGTLHNTTDANNGITTYNYDGSCNNMLSTSTTDPTVNGVTLTTSQAWDCNGGVKKSSTDANGNVTNYKYVNPTTGLPDPLWRPTQVLYPDGGNTTTTYNTGSTTPWSVSTSTAITSSLNLNSTTIYDGLGRVTQTQLTSDPDGIDYVDTTYDLLNRKATVSNPHRSAALSTDGITSYTYDALDRVTSVAETDTSHVSTTYTNTCTTATDEVGNARKSCVDGLGRLMGVWEDPGTSPHLNYETDYTYDALSNLLSVTQNGSGSANARKRTFTYDGLSRLLCAANPEIQAVTCPATNTGSFPAGAITYLYDNNSNLTSKTAPLPNQGSSSSTVTTTYSYDGLNRLTSKSYMDGNTQDPYTPTAQFGYDGMALANCTISPPGDTDSNPKGERTSMCDGSGATSWVHETMGRVRQERRSIGALGVNHYIDYTFNLDGSLKTLQTPPMKTLNYTYSGAARPTQLVDSTDNISFALSATYAPAGELAGATLGSASGFTGFTVTNYYNDRLQPILLSATNSATGATVFSDCFDFHLGVAITSTQTPPCSVAAYNPPANNGNVYQITNNRSSTRTQNFTYDYLNRVATGQSSGTQWGEQYTIDALGKSDRNQSLQRQAEREPQQFGRNEQSALRFRLRRRWQHDGQRLNIIRLRCREPPGLDFGLPLHLRRQRPARGKVPSRERDHSLPDKRHHGDALLARDGQRHAGRNRPRRQRPGRVYFLQRPKDRPPRYDLDRHDHCDPLLFFRSPGHTRRGGERHGNHVRAGH